MAARAPSPSADSHTSEAELRRILTERRAAGDRIVFTNGAFDLLHVGHVRALRDAARLGDVLVVAVNDDASVRRARGAGRPVTPLAERIEVVAAVDGVDHVLAFSDETVDRLLEELRPHVHAKGRDYAEDSLPERETNRRLGIEMAFVGDEKAHSATDVIRRLRDAPAPSRDTAAGVEPVDAGGARGFVARAARAWLGSAGLLDLAHLVTTEAGSLVEGTERRWVRRLDVDGIRVYLKVTRPAERKRSPITEFHNHVDLRASGLRAPEPLLCLEGDVDGEAAGALITREAPGQGLDAWLRGAGVCTNRHAYAVGRAVRALHEARFAHPDLQAWHLLVDASGRAVTFIDLMRLRRLRRPIARGRAARGLAALALSLRPVTPLRYRLAVLRGYLGGSLGGARPWLRAIGRRVEKLRQRGTFRHLEDARRGGPS